MLKAGLVDEAKVKAVEQSERQDKRRKSRKGKQKAKGTRRAEAKATPDSRAAAAASLKARAEKDRDHARAMALKAEKRALKLQVAEIVDRRKQPRKDGEIAYHFVDGKKVKHLYVTASQRDGLSTGRLDIVRHGNGHEVVEAEIAEKLRALDPSVVVPRRERSVEEEEAAYADHPIPDDLDW
jgi:uncharacterized protein YaiL (DUF2058 family)